LCLLLAALPGFPVIIFVLMACGLFAIAVQRSGGMPAVRGFFGKRSPATAQDAENAHIGAKGAGSTMPHDSDDITQSIPETVPLALISIWWRCRLVMWWTSLQRLSKRLDVP